MPRYIDVEKVKHIVNKYVDRTGIDTFTREDIFDFLFETDIADVQEVKHGHWVEMPRGHYFKCSECRNPIPYKFGWMLYNNVIKNKRYYNYCPNCGAKMDEEAR